MKQSRINADNSEADQLLERRLTGIIIGAFYCVYNELGFGFLEAVYRRAMYHELTDRGLSVEEEFPTDVWYKKWKAGHYRADLFVERTVIVEVKASQTLSGADLRQPINYLHCTHTQIAMLLHFGPKAKFYRYV